MFTKNRMFVGFVAASASEDLETRPHSSLTVFTITLLTRREILQNPMGLNALYGLIEP